MKNNKSLIWREKFGMEIVFFIIAYSLLVVDFFFFNVIKIFFKLSSFEIFHRTIWKCCKRKIIKDI